LEARGYYIDGTDWLDFFDSDATSFYWKNFSDKLVSLGIDAWWFDATEPENDDLVGRTVGKDELPGEIFRNIYPIKVVNTMYNGLKQARNGEEPLILTRSAAPGMQKYGAVTWSGDVGNDWETLRRQIVGGLGMMCAGQPWWTYDAGGFFRPRDQYEDAAYQERMLRWIQTSVMLPVMRVHGYMSNTEPWRYSEETEKLFTKAISDRYDLLPYIKQCAKKVANENYTLMRPLVFDFPSDEQAMLQDTEYMFGPKYLVCPVIAENVTSMEVYLPQNAKGWTCVADGKKYDGGQYVTVSVSADAVPVFERK
ncbi:MAG: glycosyl hydrolase family 31, partial [Bacteroidales bacterium]|nr:glycosyl hydrolase family 31 [Candidatus Cryptobacteroides caccocaballi]